MADFLDFFPLFGEDEDTIQTRMDTEANAGLTPGDEDYLDTREGSMYATVRRLAVIEAARLWDALSTEVPASAFLSYAWGDYLDDHGESIGVARKPSAKAAGKVTFLGTNGTIIGTGTEVSTVQADPDIDPPAFVTTQSGTIAGGTLILDVEATEAGSDGNVGAGAVTVLISPISGVSSVTNAAAITGGSDAETDQAYRDRLLLLFQGSGGGNINDYKRWALEFAGVGYAFVTPIWNGPGTVQVVVLDVNRDPVPGSVVSSLQTHLDPVAGEGRGRAPIGATVTVATATRVNVYVSATITFETGYSLTGASGTIPRKDAIEDSLRQYINGLEVGEDVVINHVESRLFVEGVYDVSTVRIGTAPSPIGTTNIVITTNPPQIATFAGSTLS